MESTVIFFLVGFLIGILLGIIVTFLSVRRSDARQEQEKQKLLEQLKQDFQQLAEQAHLKSYKKFAEVANAIFKNQTAKNSQALDNNRKLIDQQISNVNSELRRVTNLVHEFEQARATKLGELGNELAGLTRTSSYLQRALANTQARGQWGERIADDVLRLAGFVEGINYRTQQSQSGGRPDFTFLLPNERILNMDVKFPIENYLNHIRAESNADSEKYRKLFLKDVKSHINALAKKNYISPDENTVDTALMFIPNETIYRFIHENDEELVDAALEKRIVMCSPLTLYIVLAVIRQAVENFALEQSSREILEILNTIKVEWGRHSDKMTELDKALAKAREAYDDLNTTRRQKLEKPLQQIEELKEKYALSKPEQTN